MNGPIDRGSGRFEYSAYCEGLIVMCNQSNISGAVCNHYFLVNLITQLRCDLAAEDCIEHIVEKCAGSELQLTFGTVSIVCKVIVIGSKHTKSGVGVAQRNRNKPFDRRAVIYIPNTFPTDVVGRIANAKHRVEQ